MGKDCSTSNLIQKLSPFIPKLSRSKTRPVETLATATGEGARAASQCARDSPEALPRHEPPRVVLVPRPPHAHWPTRLAAGHAPQASYGVGHASV